MTALVETAKLSLLILKNTTDQICQDARKEAAEFISIGNTYFETNDDANGIYNLNKATAIFRTISMAQERVIQEALNLIELRRLVEEREQMTTCR